MLKQFTNYILEKEFKINYINNKLNIVNYISVEHFDNNKIIVKSNNANIIIYGTNLVISKLLVDELLIEGIIQKIEFR